MSQYHIHTYIHTHIQYSPVCAWYRKKDRYVKVSVPYIYIYTHTYTFTYHINFYQHSIEKRTGMPHAWICTQAYPNMNACMHAFQCTKTATTPQLNDPRSLLSAQQPSSCAQHCIFLSCCRSRYRASAVLRARIWRHIIESSVFSVLCGCIPAILLHRMDVY
jgi:hypothetical protein